MDSRNDWSYIVYTTTFIVYTTYNIHDMLCTWWLSWLAFGANKSFVLYQDLTTMIFVTVGCEYSRAWIVGMIGHI